MNRIQSIFVFGIISLVSTSMFAQVKLPTTKSAAHSTVSSSRFVRTADGRTDVVGAYRTLEDIQAAYDSNTIERYEPRDRSGAGRYPADGINVRAEAVKVVTFAKLSILEGRAWVAYYPGDKLRYAVQKDGSLYPAPFADDRCGNKIFEIAYPRVQKPMPSVQASTTVVERTVEHTPITIIVKNEIVQQAPPAPVLQGPVPQQSGIVFPAAPMTQGPAYPSMKEIGVPQAGYQPSAPVPFENGSYKKKWSVGKKWAVGLSVGIPVAALLVKSLSSKKDSPASGQQVVTH